MQKLSKRALASRDNGKLSHGPTTTAGKLRASANSTRHGMLARCILIEGEGADTFALLHQQYIDRINPTDGIEISLVEELAATVWRQRRLWRLETDLINEAARKHTGPGDRITGAFSALSRGPELHLIDRYESRLQRSFQRTLKNLQLLREIERPDDPEIAELPNEPRSEQPPVESEAYAPTSGGEDFSLLPTGPQVPPPSTIPQIPELPSEPRSEQPVLESAAYPTTSIPKSKPPATAPPSAPTPVQTKPKPVDPYEGYPRFECDPRTGSLKRVA
jgi:hypothetical protein